MIDQADAVQAGSDGFQLELERVAAGGAVDIPALFPWLTAPTVSERAAVNRRIGEALLQSGRGREATLYYERAWRLEGPPVGCEFQLPDLLFQAKRPRDALDCLREVAFDAARNGRLDVLSRAVVFFQQYSTHGDRPQQDHIVSRMAAEAFQAAAGDPPPATPLDGRIFRVGYVLYCEQDPKSTLPPIYPNYARHHDPKRVEARFYSFLTREEVLKTNPGFERIEAELAARGQVLTYVGDTSGPYGRAASVAAAMRKDGIDAALLNYGLYNNFILACLRPAPLVATIDFGDPQQYTAIPMDVNFTRFEHFKMESMCRAEELGLYFPRAVPDRSEAYARAELGFTEDQPVVICCGATYKFANPRFWGTIIMAQGIERRGFYVFVGITEEDLPDGVKDKLDLARCRFLGFRTDFSRILPAADILLDTFPMGGGHTLLEAMAHGIPCVMLAHDFKRLFDKRYNYFPYATLPYIRDLTVPAERLDQVALTLINLIRSPDERARFGQAGRSMYAEAMDGPAFMRRLEGMLMGEFDAIRQARDAETGGAAADVLRKKGVDTANSGNAIAET